MPTRNTLNQTVAAGLVTGNNIFGRAMVYYSNTGGNGLAIGVHSWIFNANGTVTKGGATADINMGGGGPIPAQLPSAISASARGYGV